MLNLKEINIILDSKLSMTTLDNEQKGKTKVASAFREGIAVVELRVKPLNF